MEHDHHNKAEKTSYQCPECGLHYKDREQAKKCEAWCKEHHSCNLKITSDAIENNIYKNNMNKHNHEHSHSHDSHEDSKVIWTCPMHPEVRKTEPGKCPGCGMELIPEKKRFVKDGNEHAGHDMQAMSRMDHEAAMTNPQIAKAARKRISLKMKNEIKFNI